MSMYRKNKVSLVFQWFIKKQLRGSGGRHGPRRVWAEPTVYCPKGIMFGEASPCFMKFFSPLAGEWVIVIMARYEHLPIYRVAFDLAVHLEKIVRNFSRYHKYSLGTELRNRSRDILETVILANESEERAAVLLVLRKKLEGLKVVARLCHESGGFSSTRSYLYVSEQVVNLAKQNEGWLRQTIGKGTDRTGRRRRRSTPSGEVGYGQNQTG